MELHSKEVVLMQSCAVRLNIVSRRNRIVAGRHIETMYVIHKLRLVKTLEQLTLRVRDGVPTHLRHFILLPSRAELQHIHVEDAQTVSIILLAVATHQLHADADAQYRLAQISDQSVQLMLLQIRHRRMSLTLTWENHLVGTLQHLEIVKAHHNLFNNWLKAKGKLGGQHKVPRLYNSRRFIDELLELNQ